MSCPSLADHVVVRVARPQHDPEDEPAVSSLDPEYFEFDCECPCPSRSRSRPPGSPTLIVLTTPPGCTDKELNKDELKQLLYDEVMSFHSLL